MSDQVAGAVARASGARPAAVVWYSTTLDMRSLLSACESVLVGHTGMTVDFLFLEDIPGLYTSNVAATGRLLQMLK